MPRYSRDFVQTMRSALDEVVTKIPEDQATSAVRAKIAELILKAAAEGQRTSEGLISSASEQVPTIISEFSFVPKVPGPKTRARND
jgi:N-acetylglucosamine kinase-like BadF-type ATPase